MKQQTYQIGNTYFDKVSKTINDKFLALLELVKVNAAIYQAITTFLDTCSIPINNLIGLATDGASTMAGEINGLKSKLKRDTNFFLHEMYVPFVAPMF